MRYSEEQLLTMYISASDYNRLFDEIISDMFIPADTVIRHTTKLPWNVLGQVQSETGHVLLNAKHRYSLQLIKTLIHELHHIHQREHNPLIFIGYKEAKAQGYEAYFNHPAEVEAREVEDYYFETNIANNLPEYTIDESITEYLDMMEAIDKLKELEKSMVK